MSNIYKQYTIDMPTFSGPLDLLLHLIDQKALDITVISLVTVTEQYLSQVRQLQEQQMERLIDFLVMGARLAQIKSRALLPQNPALITDEELEEDPAEALVRQLKAYKRFKQAARWLQEREALGWRTYLRVAPPPKLEKRLDLTGVDANSLYHALQMVLARDESRKESVTLVEPRRITIERQLRTVRRRLLSKRPFTFHDILSKTVDRVEISVSLLAVLELVKRREIRTNQQELFGPITILPFGMDEEE